MATTQNGSNGCHRYKETSFIDEDGFTSGSYKYASN